MNLSKIEKSKQKERFITTLFLILIFFMAIRLPVDTDFWWHLRSGQLTVQNRAPILQDVTSFTAFSQPWVNHSWLSQVIFFEIYKIAGETGVMLFVAIIATISIAFIYLRLKGNIFLKSLVILLGVLTTAVVWSPRPQLLSLLFFALLLFFVEGENFKINTSTLILLPIFFIVWGNLHAGFSIGFIYLLCKLAGMIFDLIISNSWTDKIKWKAVYQWLGLLLISAMAVIINPNGINIWLVQFNTISIPSLQNLIPEWASPNFHELYQQPFLWLWVLLIAFIMANGRQYKFQTIFPLIVLGALGFISRRNYVYFSVFTIPILNSELNIFWKKRVHHINWLENILTKMSSMNKEPNLAFSKIINSTIIFLLCFVTVGKIIYLGNPMIYKAYLNQLYPFELLTELRKQDPSAQRCLNSYAWGGFLSWNVPEMLIFIDGRTDLYGEKIINDWLSMVNAGDEWRKEFNNYRINCIILEKNRPIVDHLISDSWKILYEDNQAIYLMK